MFTSTLVWDCHLVILGSHTQMHKQRNVLAPLDIRQAKCHIEFYSCTKPTYKKFKDRFDLMKIIESTYYLMFLINDCFIIIIIIIICYTIISHFGCLSSLYHEICLTRFKQLVSKLKCPPPTNNMYFYILFIRLSILRSQTHCEFTVNSSNNEKTKYS